MPLRVGMAICPRTPPPQPSSSLRHPAKGSGAMLLGLVEKQTNYKQSFVMLLCLYGLRGPFLPAPLATMPSKTFASSTSVAAPQLRYLNDTGCSVCVL